MDKRSSLFSGDEENEFVQRVSSGSIRLGINYWVLNKTKQKE
jgi:hypothetical protein